MKGNKMVLKEWLNQFKKYKTVIIFGYAAFGKNLYKRIKISGFTGGLVYCDNSSEKQSMKGAEKVYSINEAVNIPMSCFVIASIWHGKQMREQLISAGVKDQDIKNEFPVEIMEEERLRNEQLRTAVMEGYRIEVNINKHCNLNCKGCDHFAPVSGPDFMSVDVFSRDMRELKRLFCHLEGEFRLLGGEPLMNPDIIQFIEITRSNLPKAKVLISTNGILLKKMDESFYEACRKADVGIEVTRYPIKLDYDELGEWIRGKGLRYSYIGASESGRELWHFPLDIEGKQDPVESFRGCRNANYCWTLEEGRLYTCSIAPNIKVFENRFNKGIHLTPEDGVDIYTTKDAHEVAMALAQPMPFCRYCNVKGRTYDHPWEVSKRDIAEWT